MPRIRIRDESRTLVDRAKEQMLLLGYKTRTCENYMTRMRRFLRHLESNRKPLASVQMDDIIAYLDSFRPALSVLHRRYHRAAIGLLVRNTLGYWPIPRVITTPQEKARARMCNAYARYMENVRGLAPATRDQRTAELENLLQWCQGRGLELRNIAITHLDEYIASRTRLLRRISKASVLVALRDIVRHLRLEGLIKRDFSPLLRGPLIYRHEKIPRFLTNTQVTSLIKESSRDDSALGIRDHAAILLMARYGLRVGEVVELRLDDLDWHGKCFRISRRKNGTPNVYPLLPEIGEALLRYLQEVRPKTPTRAVFVRIKAPHTQIRSGVTFRKALGRLYKYAGIPQGPGMGPHALRHARATSMLQAGASLKTIGDILGHRSPSSTTIYLKVDKEGLRKIALNVPRGAAP